MSGASEHYNDAWAEIYQRGYNADRLDVDQAYNDYYDGVDPEVTANREIRRQRDERQRRRDAWENEGCDY